MATITEIAPDLYRICTYIPQFNLQFNQFIARGEQPLVFHTGLKSLFPGVREAAASLIDLNRLRFIAFSHFEADECGPLNEWLTVAPQSEPVCSMTAKMVSVDDLALRPARGMTTGDVVETGSHRFRFIQTPHVPHSWEAGLMFEEVNRVLLCSDLFHQGGNPDPMTESDVVVGAKQTYDHYRGTPLDNYMPYTPYTDRTLQTLADLKPRVCATMHGATFVGDGEAALRRLAGVMREILSGD